MFYTSPWRPAKHIPWSQTQSVEAFFLFYLAMDGPRTVRKPWPLAFSISNNMFQLNRIRWWRQSDATATWLHESRGLETMMRVLNLDFSIFKPLKHGLILFEVLHTNTAIYTNIFLSFFLFISIV